MPIIHRALDGLQANHVIAAYVIIITAGLMITGLLIWLIVMVIKKIVSVSKKKRKELPVKKSKIAKTPKITKFYKKLDSDATDNLSL